MLSKKRYDAIAAWDEIVNAEGTDEILEGVVTEGTGSNAAITGYSIGGKTGTAEKAIKDKENYLVSFIGFSPVEKPEVLIYVIVDEPNVEKQSNSKYASGLARDILEEIFDEKNMIMSVVICKKTKNKEK